MDNMMHYCVVRRELLAEDPEQTCRKEVVPAGDDVGINNFRTNRSHSECDCHDYKFRDVTVQEDHFDFYLAVAEADLIPFGIPFSEMVQERMNMRPCLTVQHVDIGAPKYETMARYLETRCGGKVVFVVSKNFADSDECQFLVHFAKTLDPFAKEQKLIPLVIDKNVTVPRVLEGLCSINYNAAIREKWLGKRLWEAIRGAPAARTQRSISAPAP
ncbi:myeloid differentiation primary response protein MyD88-like [Babylonia areolata]|uniref:myeloid differentiation primary response protein MyD88-like n=1 Tax=Babylonia areolata TaxID=304850 RepID=UPI003FD575D5